jgi:type VI secretion system protein ImpG
MSRHADLLRWVADGGAALAADAPRLAGALADASLDPDAERLIEGGVHLVANELANAARTATRVFDLASALYFPELTRTFPATAIARFDAPRSASLPRGTRLAASGYDGLGALGFVNVYDVDGGPLRLERLTVDGGAGRSTIELSLSGLDLDAEQPDRLRLFLGTEPTQAFTLHHALARAFEGAEWLDAEGRSSGVAPEIRVTPLGLDPRQTLAGAAEPRATDLGDPTCWAMLRAWLTAPSLFTFVDLDGVIGAARRLGVRGASARLRLRVRTELPRSLGASAETVWLHATPVVNLFPSDADPATLAPATSLVAVRPRPGEEVERVRRVIAFGPRGRRLVPLVEQLTGRDARARAEFAQVFGYVAARGRLVHRAWIARRGVPEANETLSFEILATNGARVRACRVGDRLEPQTWSRAGHLRFATGAIGPHAAPRGHAARRAFVRLATLASKGLDDVEALRALVSTLHASASESASAARELLALEGALDELRVEEHPVIVDGAVVRGVRHVLRIDESAFATNGEVSLLGAVLARVFGAQVGLDAIGELRVEELKSRRVHTFTTPPPPAEPLGAPARPWRPPVEALARDALTDGLTVAAPVESTADAGLPVRSATGPNALADDPRLEAVFDDPTALGFLELLALFERILDRPVGLADEPRADPFRLKPSPSLAFPVADVLDVASRAEDGRVVVTTGFAGLYGVSSPLPSVYVDRWAHLASERAGKRVLAFLDVLHHRLLGLHYRAERRSLTSALAEPDVLLERLGTLTGLAPGASGATDTRGAAAAPALARWFVHRARSAPLLEAALAVRLGRPIEVEALSPRRVAIPAGQRSRLGARPRADGVHAANVLGSSLVLGRSVVARSGVTVRTVAYAASELAALSPGGTLHAEASALVAAFGHVNEPRLEVTLPDAVAPRPLLFGPRRRGEAAVLGRTAWLGGSTARDKVLRVRLDAE